MNPVSEQFRRAISVSESARLTAPLLCLGEVPYGHPVGRGMGMSTLAHGLALLMFLVISRQISMGPRLTAKPKFEKGEAARMLILPALGGGHEGGGRAGGKQGHAGKMSSGLLARSRRGFAYPGPQPVVSTPPQAKLGIQTILQPHFQNLPRLRTYVELPNIVEPQAPQAEQKAPVLMVKPDKLSLRPPDEKPISAPSVTLPVASNSKIADLIESKAPLPQRAVPDPVDPAETSPLSIRKTGLLVLNAVPPPPDLSANVPRAEARSLFAVSTAEATIIAAPAVGTTTAEAVPVAAGTGTSTDIRSGDALAEAASAGDSSHTGAGGSNGGSGGRYGNAEGGGLNSASIDSGIGRGTNSGAGLGTGASTGRGTGAGAGSAPGHGGFTGITIQGGRYGNTGSMLAKPDVHGQTSYNMTIVSTSNSGGGLPDLGVFRNEKIYTVYLDMRSSDDDPAPSWTLQYAVLQPASNPDRLRGTPMPPYPTLKELPVFAPALVRNCARGLILVSAILDTAGTLHEVSVRRTPENAVIDPLTEALQHWMFEPAKIDGQPVALKILLGIRLATLR